jgi:hypothetical protein
VLNDIVYNCESVLDKNLKLSDIDLEFVSTVSGPKTGTTLCNNPDRALVRYQFLELFVRIGLTKYLKSKIVTIIDKVE